MKVFQLDRFSFFYPEQEKAALSEIDLDLYQGEFVTICGTSGCGKSTLLRHLKTSLAPHGTRHGIIRFEGIPLSEVDHRTQAAKIGYLFQNPENQIVTDKVWHELAFGLESLGFKTSEIRMRVAEMASFFGIQSWFYKNVSELSGGQKQLLNLAAVMALQPSVLILDEPTGQLDPIAASEFLTAVSRINRELGVAVVLVEHRLEEAFPLSDRVIVMDEGRIIHEGGPKDVGMALFRQSHAMFSAMPVPIKVYAGIPNELECPVSVREGHDWLVKLAETREIWQERFHSEKEFSGGQNDAAETVGNNDSAVLVMDEVWFRYEKDGPDVIKGLNLTVSKGEFVAILGAMVQGRQPLCR